MLTFKADDIAHDWIESNIQTMIRKIMEDARFQRKLPLKITCHPIALKKFIEILKSKNVYFPKEDGTLDFLQIPIQENSRLPYGTITVERWQ